jgi:hypothetical protein
MVVMILDFILWNYYIHKEYSLIRIHVNSFQNPEIEITNTLHTILIF